MEQEGKIRFFGRYNLHGFIYTIHIDRKNNQEVLNLSKRIYKLGGKISFTISAETIIIVEEIQIKSIEKMLELNRQFDRAYIFENQKIIQLKAKGKHSIESSNTQSECGKVDLTELAEKMKEKSMKIINLKDLTNQMEKLEKYSIENHYSAGLPRDIDLNSAISIVNNPKEKAKKELHYHSFERLMDPKDPNNENRRFYDVPRYYKKAPDNFSSFMTISEFRHIRHYILQKKSTTGNQIEKSEDETTIDDEYDLTPIPHKSTVICNLCNATFRDYTKHIKTESHLKNYQNNYKAYDRISNSFKRIRQFWKERASKENKKEERQSHEGEAKEKNELKLNMIPDLLHSVDIFNMESAKKIYDVENMSNPYIQSYLKNASFLESSCKSCNYTADIHRVPSNVEIIDIKKSCEGIEKFQIESFSHQLMGNKDFNISEGNIIPQKQDCAPEIKLLNTKTKRPLKKAKQDGKRKEASMEPVRITRSKMNRILEKDEELKNFVYFTLKDDKYFQVGKKVKHNKKKY